MRLWPCLEIRAAEIHTVENCCGPKIWMTGKYTCTTKTSRNSSIKRKIGMIFQKPVLYPHLSVEKNIQLGLPKSTTKTDGKKQIEEILATVQLEGFEKRKVDELSGGEKQRISFARAMLSKPEALMMDEPFSALDNEIRNDCVTGRGNFSRRWRSQ